MQASPNSVFLLATPPDVDPNNADPIVYGSVFLHWDTCLASECGLNGGKQVVRGKFSAVAVDPAWEKRGVGQFLVASVEHFLQERADSLFGASSAQTVCEMGVLNVRPDLFAWYERQGYTRGERLPHDAELARIINPGLDVWCILWRKVLPPL